MSFREWSLRSVPEHQTAPDVILRRGSKGGGERNSIISSHNTNNSRIPVLERRKMFEQTDSGFSEKSSGHGMSGHRRATTGGRLTSRKDISRSSSFKSSKRIKTEDGSPIMARNKQLGNNSILPLWQRLRNFGHYDVQSLTLEKLAITSSTGTPEHNVKRPTGASAALAQDDTNVGNGVEYVSNALVATCPAFKNEVGGDSVHLSEDLMQLRDSLSLDIQKRIGSREKILLDGEVPLKDIVGNRKMSKHVLRVLQPQTGMHFPFEYIDYGASYYRSYFLGQEHQNFFGVDENLGPIAISLKREKLSEQIADFYGTQPVPGQPPVLVPKHMYRIIFRTSQLTTLRGAILEDSVPSGSKHGTSKGIPPRDVIEHISQGEMQLACLKLGKAEKKVYQELVKLDEQELSNKYKIGVIYCKKGQTTEEEMYNNESGSSAFDVFLDLLGDRVKMQGFTKYRAQLDNKTDTTGEFSVYTEFRDAEVMFHVSTLLPYTSSNKQQLLRKRHIGNDIVTIIFQEPGCEPFSARGIRSHFQHIFVVVRVENPLTPHAKYKVAVTRSQDIPYFGPTVPEGAEFDSNETFREFLLTKLINACNASLRNEKFSTMAVRTRKQYLNDLADNSTTSVTIDQAHPSGRVAGLLRNLSRSKREKMRQESTLIYTPGALVWNVRLILRKGRPLPFSEEHDFHLDCLMCIGPDLMVLIDNVTKEMIFNLPLKNLTGWIIERARMNLFYDNCFCLSLESPEGEDELGEIALRLQAIAPCITLSHEATLMEFQRATTGLLGFGINEAGVVQKVDGLAKSIGLQINSKILQVEDRLLCSHSHTQIMDLLLDKYRHSVKAYVVPPPPPHRRVPFFYPSLNWSAIWNSRPSHADSDERKTSQNGSEPMDTVEFRDHRRRGSNVNRLSYMEAMESGDIKQPNFNQPQDLQLPIDDQEPIYDRLQTMDKTKVSLRRPKSPQRVRSPTHRARSPIPSYRKFPPEDNAGYTRVKKSMRATRESVVQFADDLMERNFSRSQPWDPTPVEHTIDEYSPHIEAKISSSTAIPSHRAHTAAPLSSKYTAGQKRPISQREIVKKPSVDVSSPGGRTENQSTPGFVELSKRFSFTSPSTGTPTGSSGLTTGSKAASKIPVPTAGGSSTPMKATTNTSEMTKTGIPVPVRSVTADDNKRTSFVPLSNGVADENGVPLRNKRSPRMRPASWDASLLFNNEKNEFESRRDDSAFDTEARNDSQSFERNSNIRTAFRSRRLSSRENLTETTGAPVNGSTSPSKSEEIGRNDEEELSEMLEMEGLPTEMSQESSQNSQDSQGSLVGPLLSVRERTMKWEARGGGLPSYFATLPKSFRHKATDLSSSSSSPAQSPTSHHPPQLQRRVTVATNIMSSPSSSSSQVPTSFGTRRATSNIPQPIRRVGSPRSSAAVMSPTTTTTVSGTKILGSPLSNKILQPREEADGCSNPEDSISPSLSSPAGILDDGKSDGVDGKTNNEVGVSSSGHQPVIKTKSVTVGVAKTRGQSLLPTKTQISASSSLPVSTQRSSQPIATTSDGRRKSAIPRAVTTLSPEHGRVTLGTFVRRSSVPPSSKLLESTSSDTLTSDGAPHTSSAPPPRKNDVISNQETEIRTRQQESPSRTTTDVQSDFQVLTLNDEIPNYNSPPLLDGGRDRSSGHGHIEEWIQQTSKTALSPEALADSVPPPSVPPVRDMTSPTFTESSFTYSHTSDVSSQELVDSLKHKVDSLENRLEKETESNVELRMKLRKLERQLQEAQSGKHQHHHRNVTVTKTALI